MWQCSLKPSDCAHFYSIFLEWCWKVNCWVLGKGVSGWAENSGQTCSVVLLMQAEPLCSKKSWVFKGPWWDKTWGNSYNSWPENFDWISFVFWWRQGTDWTCLAHPTAEETSVTRAAESKRQKERSYRKIAGETAALKLRWRGAVWADWVWGGREVPIEN